MPGGIAAVIFVNMKGEVVLYKTYRDGVSRQTADSFRSSVIAAKEAQRSPIKHIGDASFLHVRQDNMYVVAVTQENTNACMTYSFLYKLCGLLSNYFGGVVDENSIRNNFVLMYELLDEIMDFGYPQLTNVETLKLYITQEGDKSAAKASNDKAPTANAITIQATGAINWRKEGLKYKKNELFIDVVEHCNLLMSNKGTVLKNDVSGQVMVKCYLSGMPECKFGLNDKLMLDAEQKNKSSARKSSGIDIDDCSFHQCVKLGKFDTDRTISFVPPDGEFQLMAYRISDNVNLPFRILPVIKELGRTRIEINVKVKSMFTFKLFATNVLIKIPVPPNTAVCNISAGTGRYKFEPSEKVIIWKLRRFPGDTEYCLSGEVEMVAAINEKSWSRPPISMDFQVPMFAASGLHVRFLRVFEKSNYQTIKWVRYITKSGNFQHRI